tara:strand:+ start:3054 stop:3440 length:387 start_codon:yes stop_codon:yes gene_type:complete
MSIDFTSEIRRILDDHKHLSLQDEQNLNYLVGMIREALDDREPDGQQLELFQGTTGEKISQHKIDAIEYDEFEDESTRLSGIKYSEFANLGFGDKDITHDGDGKALTKPSYQKRIKSYGFFKNEYYDD